jgi:hypothetical protein
MSQWHTQSVTIVEEELEDEIVVSNAERPNSTEYSTVVKKLQNLVHTCSFGDCAFEEHHVHIVRPS